MGRDNTIPGLFGRGIERLSADPTDFPQQGRFTGGTLSDLGRCAVATSAAHLPDKYGLGWTVEAFYKSIQSNTGYAHWPAHQVRTQGNHLFLVMRGRPCGGLCDVSSGERSYSVEPFCVEGPTAIKSVKNSVGAVERPQASLFYTCSTCVTSVYNFNSPTPS